MNKNKNYFDIDISEDVFDICDISASYYQFKNSVSGFKKLLKLIDYDKICVMEAAGYYHVRLIYFLIEPRFRISAVNPLKIKRFIQMELFKNMRLIKMIQLYGKERL